ncbi:MAG: hypothetical protein FWD82_00855 [Defluviitaleaceae bacterium]|nr:hypothetical protein [Defluviitaleaceae bacterium]
MDILTRYRRALDDFVEKVKKDKNVIGVLLAGSTYYNSINDESDVNIILVVVDGSLERSSFMCIDNDIIFNIDVFERTQIVQNLSRQFGDMYRYSYLTNCEFVYCKDESFSDYLSEVKRVKKDAFDFSTFCDFSNILYRMSVIRKHLNTECGITYSQYTFVKISELLSKIEHTMQYKMFSQDVVLQAYCVDSDIIRLFKELFLGEWNTDKCEYVLKILENYFDEHISIIQRPIINLYKKANKTILTLHEIAGYFGFYAPFLYLGCDYLAKKQILTKVTMPALLIKKGKIEIEEVAYLNNNVELEF